MLGKPKVLLPPIGLDKDTLKIDEFTIKTISVF